MKRINDTLIFLCSLISICFLVRDINIGVYDRLLGDASIIFVLFIPKIARKLFKLKISNGLELVYIIFIILAQFLGSIVNLYNTTWWYDLFMHFLSGSLTAVLALVIMNWLGVYKSKNKLFNVLFMISFSSFIASFWEFGEYLTYIILGMDVQHNLTTGVNDTMQDMLIAFLGCIIVVVKYLFENKKDGLIKKVVNTLK